MLWSLIWITIVIIAALAFAYINVYLWLLPMNRVRGLHETGFNHLRKYGRDSAARKKLWINRSLKLRKVGNTPPPFPNGWFVLAESREVSVCSSV